MSMSTDTIYCTQCEFILDSSGLWSRDSYLLPCGGIVPIGISVAWCEACDSLCPIEIIPDEANLRQLLSNAENELSDLAPPPEKSWRQKVFSGGWRETMKAWGKKRGELELAATTAREFFALMRARQAPVHCLRCGGTLLIENPMAAQSGGEAPIHPGCGGVLRRRPSGARVSISPWGDLYSTEGVYIGRAQPKSAGGSWFT